MPDSGPLKEIRVQLKTRMDKAVEDFRKAMAIGAVAAKGKVRLVSRRKAK